MMEKKLYIILVNAISLVLCSAVLIACYGQSAESTEETELIRKSNAELSTDTSVNTTRNTESAISNDNTIDLHDEVESAGDKAPEAESVGGEASDKSVTTDGEATLVPPATVGDTTLTEEQTGELSDEEFFASLTAKQEQQISERAYPLSAAIWPQPNIFVCWEKTPEQFSELRDLVRKSISESWAAISALEFKGWGQCRDGVSGIRIAVEDAGPHVKKLGQFVSGMDNGMVLNFTYNNWGTNCKDKVDTCTRIIAIHEFGHAIGYAHEQNRPDTPGECDQRQGSDGDNTSLTPWDKNSVMNYCNPAYGNDGELSRYDIVATKQIYGDV